MLNLHVFSWDWYSGGSLTSLTLSGATLFVCVYPNIVFLDGLDWESRYRCIVVNCHPGAQIILDHCYKQFKLCHCTHLSAFSNHPLSRAWLQMIPNLYHLFRTFVPIQNTVVRDRENSKLGTYRRCTTVMQIQILTCQYQLTTQKALFLYRGHKWLRSEGLCLGSALL